MERAIEPETADEDQAGSLGSELLSLEVYKKHQETGFQLGL